MTTTMPQRHICRMRGGEGLVLKRVDHLLRMLLMGLKDGECVLEQRLHFAVLDIGDKTQEADGGGEHRPLLELLL